MKSASEKIQSASGFQLSRVLIADVEDANAFATREKDGSPIAVVTLGMMSAIAGDEDAWAGLLGHEVAHLVRRHSDIRGQAQAKARGAGNVAANVVSAVVPGVGGLIGATVAGTVTHMVVYGSYTRPQEAEADELGLQWMFAAGYDPRGLVRLFDVLARSASMPAFLSTHPAAQDRAQAVEAQIARGIAPPPPLVDSRPKPSDTTYQTAASFAGVVLADAANCSDATSEMRLKALCQSADGCMHQVDAITKFCTNASKGPCSSAYEQLPMVCGERSKAYSEQACEVTAQQVRVHCGD